MLWYVAKPAHCAPKVYFTLVPAIKKLNYNKNENFNIYASFKNYVLAAQPNLTSLPKLLSSSGGLGSRHFSWL